jgi:hypothetical protein
MPGKVRKAKKGTVRQDPTGMLASFVAKATGLTFMVLFDAGMAQLREDAIQELRSELEHMGDDKGR